MEESWRRRIIFSVSPQSAQPHNTCYVVSLPWWVVLSPPCKKSRCLAPALISINGFPTFQDLNLPALLRAGLPDDECVPLGRNGIPPCFLLGLCTFSADTRFSPLIWTRVRASFLFFRPQVLLNGPAFLPAPAVQLPTFCLPLPVYFESTAMPHLRVQRSGIIFLCPHQSESVGIKGD